MSVGYISQLERGVTKISLDTLGSVAALPEREPAFFLNGAVPQQELGHIFDRLSPEGKRLLLELAEVVAGNELRQ